MRYEVPPDAGGLTLGKYLYGRLKLSRTLVRRLKNAGGILVDGIPARVDLMLCGGEALVLRTDQTGRVQAEPLPLQVWYEDAHVLAVEKPAGMVVHPVKQYDSGTLANSVAHHLQLRGEEPIARPVLRIDRETSGLVLFAKTPVAAQRLSRGLERHKLERRYVAFVSGPMPSESGSVTVPIRRVWGHPVAREAAMGPRTEEQEALLSQAETAGRILPADWTGKGQKAMTHWQLLRRWPEVDKLALQLETGRTHQIRVHMAYLGHPLLGDSLYGSGGPPGRQALHAASLVFDHPETGRRIELASPLPPDLADMEEILDRGGHVM